MLKYKDGKNKKIKKLNDENFKRIVGVKKETFEKMVNIYKNALIEIQKSFGIGGRKSKLSSEEKVLLTLEYYREYRTLAI